MGMGRRQDNIFSRYDIRRQRQYPRPQFGRNHDMVDTDQKDPGRSIIKIERTRPDRIVYPGRITSHAIPIPVERRTYRRRDVYTPGAGFQRFRRHGAHTKR